MANRPVLNAQQRRLRAELVRLREERGLERPDVAERIGITDLTLWRYETGRSRPKPTDVQVLLGVYDAPAALRTELLEAAKGARRRTTGWWHRHRKALKKGFDSYLPLEDEASVLRVYEAQVVPGILQADRYARHVIEATAVGEDLDDLDEKLVVRATRQERLSDADHPLQVVAVVDEAALRRPIGGPDVMREQLEKLLELGKLDGVAIHILPFLAGAHAALDGSFHLLSFHPSDQDVVYLEQAGSGLVPEEPSEIRRYTLMFGNLIAKALDTRESAAFIRELATEG